MICTTCNGSGCVNIDDGNLSLGWLRCTDCSGPRWSTREHEEIVGGNDVVESSGRGTTESVFRPPPALTDEDYERIAEESRACREACEKATAGMERLAADDLRIVIR